MLAIRNANAADASLLAAMIREFAEFERERELVEITPEDVLRDGFGPHPHFQSLIAEWDDEAAAYAVYFFAYSTWSGRHVLFVEDLFVRAEFRQKGIGEALLKRMAVIAREQNCYGMRWEVMNWNGVAIDFYRSRGASVQSDRLQVFLTGDQFAEFARQGDH